MKLYVLTNYNHQFLGNFTTYELAQHHAYCAVKWLHDNHEDAPPIEPLYWSHVGDENWVAYTHSLFEMEDGPLFKFAIRVFEVDTPQEIMMDDINGPVPDGFLRLYKDYDKDYPA